MTIRYIALSADGALKRLATGEVVVAESGHAESFVNEEDAQRLALDHTYMGKQGRPPLTFTQSISVLE